MNRISKITMVLSTAVVLSACARSEPEPMVVTQEPVYTDKWGNEIDGGGCSGGTAGATNCLPPAYEPDGGSEGSSGSTSS